MKVFYMGRKGQKVVNGRVFKRGSGIDVDAVTGAELLKSGFVEKLDKKKLTEIENSVKAAQLKAEIPATIVDILRAENESLRAENESLQTASSVK